MRWGQDSLDKQVFRARDLQGNKRRTRCTCALFSSALCVYMDCSVSTS